MWQISIRRVCQLVGQLVLLALIIFGLSYLLTGQTINIKQVETQLPHFAEQGLNSLFLIVLSTIICSFFLLLCWLIGHRAQSFGRHIVLFLRTLINAIPTILLVSLGFYLFVITLHWSDATTRISVNFMQVFIPGLLLALISLGWWLQEIRNDTEKKVQPGALIRISLKLCFSLIVAEKVFSYPGLGLLLIQTLDVHHFQGALALVGLVSCITLIINFIVQLKQAIISQKEVEND